MSVERASTVLAAVAGFAVLASGATAGSLDRPITYARHVAPIFQESCQSCHRPGDIAPMSLLTYREVRPWAKAIRQTVFDRVMPPWHADAPPGTFANDRSLTREEIATILAWVDQGAIEGEGADLPPSITFTIDDWKAGTPDLVYWMPETYTLKAEVLDEYRCFVIPEAIEHELWYSGIEIKPGNTEVVHHVIVFADTSGASLERDAADPSPGFPCGMASGGIGLQMLGDWEPGARAMIAPDGIATKIDAGTTLVYQIHYHNTNGVDQQDRSGLALYLTRGRVEQQPRMVAIYEQRLHIAAGDPDAENSAEWVAPADLHLRSIMPHMHYLGKDMTVTAQMLGGPERTLLSVPRYDFNWQTSYVFREPVAIPEGTRLRMVSHHDNSSKNPNNPFDPPRDVPFGEATHEEMAVAWSSYTLDDERLGVEPALPTAMIDANRSREKARLARESEPVSTAGDR